MSGLRIMRCVEGSLVVLVMSCACMGQVTDLGQPPRPLRVPVPRGSFSGPEAEALAAQLGLPLRASHDSGVIALSGFIDGTPVYWCTDNARAADTISTDEVREGGNLGLSLNGAGVVIGLWDPGGVIRLSHQEFAGASTSGDGGGVFSDHPTLVGATMVARGIDPLAIGMASAASLRSFEINNSLGELNSQASSAGLRLSNHSYSQTHGWFLDQGNSFGNGFGRWHWMGGAQTLDTGFGSYNDITRSYDAIMASNPRLLMCMSASNQRGNGPSPGSTFYYWNPDREPNPGWTMKVWAPGDPPVNPDYDCVPGINTPKNGLTVGNVYAITGGYTFADGVQLHPTSGVGPSDDGRIKPDVVAQGVSLLTAVAFFPGGGPCTDQYARVSGTSMSSASVCGSTALLLQYWRQLRPNSSDPLSSTLRALILHTADEAGPAPGPDYRFGWGLMNTRSAARALHQHGETGYSLVDEQVLPAESGAVWTRVVQTLPADGSFKVTVAWVDPAGTPSTPLVLNDRTPKLVNDLDVRVVDVATGVAWMPWVLDPAQPQNPAQRGDNVVDNIEQVLVPDASGTVERTWEIRVSHKGVLAADQIFSIVITGAFHPPVPPSSCDDSDFNQDGDYGTDADIESFFACLGGACPEGVVNADFNHDGDVGTDADIESFFRVLAGGPC